MNTLISIFVFVFLFGLFFLGYFFYNWKKNEIINYFKKNDLKENKKIISKRKNKKTLKINNYSGLITKIIFNTVVIFVFITIFSNIMSTEFEIEKSSINNSEINTTEDYLQENYGINKNLLLVFVIVPFVVITLGSVMRFISYD
jgi:hypothetical protein